MPFDLPFTQCFERLLGDLAFDGHVGHVMGDIDFADLFAGDKSIGGQGNQDIAGAVDG